MGRKKGGGAYRCCLRWTHLSNRDSHSTGWFYIDVSIWTLRVCVWARSDPYNWDWSLSHPFVSRSIQQRRQDLHKLFSFFLFLLSSSSLCLFLSCNWWMNQLLVLKYSSNPALNVKDERVRFFFSIIVSRFRNKNRTWDGDVDICQLVSLLLPLPRFYIYFFSRWIFIEYPNSDKFLPAMIMLTQLEKNHY